MSKKVKNKKGTDHGRGGGPVDEAKEKLTEVDKEWFQIQIKSLEEKLHRRNEKMKRLEQSNSELQERYDVLREDKADIIAYLKRTLQQRTDQISELQARLEGLQQVHEADAEKAKKQLTSLSQEAERTKGQLVSENMVLTKKLDALEEFRIQRDQLMKKFEDQEQQREVMKHEYEDKLEKLEKKHIIEEDRLKKEMFAKLESVAAEFRKASTAQMAATTQRTIRENVSISSQINILSDKVNELTYDNEMLEEKNRELKKAIEAMESEQRSLMQRNAFRLKVIEELSNRYSTQESEVQRSATLLSERRLYEERIARLEHELNEAHMAMDSNVLATKEKESTISEMQMKLAGISKTKDLINECLNEASGSIKAALALQAASEEEDTKTGREKVLNQLLVMLNTAISEKKREQKMKNEPGLQDIDYLQGSLGLVPPDT